MEEQLNKCLNIKFSIQDLNDQVILKLTEYFKEHVARLKEKPCNDQKI